MCSKYVINPVGIVLAELLMLVGSFPLDWLVCVCVCVFNGIYMEVREQSLSVGSLLPQCGSNVTSRDAVDLSVTSSYALALIYCLLLSLPGVWDTNESGPRVLSACCAP